MREEKSMDNINYNIRMALQQLADFAAHTDSCIENNVIESDGVVREFAETSADIVTLVCECELVYRNGKWVHVDDNAVYATISEYIFAQEED